MNRTEKANNKVLKKAKFSFPTKEIAEKAKIHLSKEYPTVRMDVTECGNLFCYTNGSMLYDFELTSKVNSLGGSIVHGST